MLFRRAAAAATKASPNAATATANIVMTARSQACVVRDEALVVIVLHLQTPIDGVLSFTVLLGLQILFVIFCHSVLLGFLDHHLAPIFGVGNNKLLPRILMVFAILIPIGVHSRRHSLLPLGLHNSGFDRWWQTRHHTLLPSATSTTKLVCSLACIFLVAKLLAEAFLRVQLGILCTALTFRIFETSQILA